MNKKVIGLGLSLMMVCSMMVGCSDGENARYQDKRESKQALSNSRAIVGSPEIRHFTEKKNLKEILELRDNPKLICHYYTKNTMTGKYIYQGKCSGYGIPYASSYTTPNDSEGEPIDYLDARVPFHYKDVKYQSMDINDYIAMVEEIERREELEIIKILKERNIID